MKIVLIGAGNVATHLGLALVKAGHSIEQVYSRTEYASKTLAKKLSGSSTTKINEISGKADLYLVALSDEAIKPFLISFKFADKTILHTSGSMSISVFGKRFKNCGVFYPVQTFSKRRKINFKNIPVCVESRNIQVNRRISILAQSLVVNTHVCDSKERKAIHLAAVFANNFSNHLFAISEKILKQNNISFNILRPLIWETALKVQHESPDRMQTGPAKRGDRIVLNEHMNMLKHNKRFLAIYSLLSESISDMDGMRL